MKNARINYLVPLSLIVVAWLLIYFLCLVGYYPSKPQSDPRVHGFAACLGELTTCFQFPTDKCVEDFNTCIDNVNGVYKGE